MKAQPAPKPDRGEVVAKAFYRAAEAMEFSRQDMAEVLGLSESTLSRQLTTLAEKHPVKFDGKTSEIALLFIRAYRSLIAIYGGDERKANVWFDADNSYLGAKPKDLVKTINGLADVTGYLDAMRAKV